MEINGKFVFFLNATLGVPRGKVYYIYEKQLKRSELIEAIGHISSGYGPPEADDVDIFDILQKFIPENTAIKDAPKKIYSLINKTATKKHSSPIEKQVVIDPQGILRLVSEIVRNNDGSIAYSLTDLNGYSDSFTEKEILPLAI